MDTDKIPTQDECYKLIQQYGMLPNIIQHSEMVARVALVIAEHLHDGTFIDKDLLTAASLLHDITKTRSLKTKEPHDRSGGRLLRDLGFDKIAQIVEEHVIMNNFDPDSALEEREIVFYADKRVMHDRIVSVDERVDDLVERYGTTPERKYLIDQNRDFILSVERKINRHLTRDINEVIASVD